MNELRNLAVDGVVDLFVGTVHILYASVVDELFDHKGRQIETDEIRSGDDMPYRGDLIVDVKFIGPGKLLKASGYLFLDRVFTVRFNELVLDNLHGNGVAERFGNISQLLQGQAKRPFL
jgi:hypothetical protein